MRPYRVGIEEEFFVSDLRTRNVRRTMSKAFYGACKRELGDAVTRELLQSQIEVRTPPCETIAEARSHLTHCRKVLARYAARHGLAIVASGTHPLATWPEQKHTLKERYGEVREDLQMLARRNMVCGMHVHVEVPEPQSRIGIMIRLMPFIPPLLGLSTSSPFWQGRRTGLLGYRLTAYDELPRTGLPELFHTAEEYQRYIDTLTEAGVIKNASYVWWAVRPSLVHPTLELRVADCCTHIEDTVCIAAMYRGIIRHLVENPELNADLDSVGRAIADENKWRAQRYGTAATFIDQKTRKAQPFEDVVRYILDLIRPDTDALECTDEAAFALEILKRGSSADQQIRIYRKSRDEGASRPQALKDVVLWLTQNSTPVPP
jgi:glutamate---cysteine ligase / carboxylate-amine ligase